MDFTMVTQAEIKSVGKETKSNTNTFCLDWREFLMTTFVLE